MKHHVNQPMLAKRLTSTHRCCRNSSRRGTRRVEAREGRGGKVEIEIGNVVRVGGEQYLVRSLENGVHGVRVTDEELEADDDLGGRRTLYLGTTDSLESEGAQVVALG